MAITIGRAVSRFDYDFASFRHGLSRIYDQVHQDLTQDSFVSPDPIRFMVEFEANSDGFLDHTSDHFRGVTDYDIEIERFEAGLLVATEKEQLFHQSH